MANIKRGKIIAIDGPDGSGKTTQIRLLHDLLVKKGYDVHLTRASGGTPIGEKLREVSLCMHPRQPNTDVYISLAMHYELGCDLRERANRGQICLVDRSPLAIIAYQVFARDADKNIGYNAAEMLLKLWAIDELFVFNADQSTLDQRRKLRTDKPVDFFEKQTDDFFTGVQAGYNDSIRFVKSLSDLPTSINIIEAGGSISEVQSQIIKNLSTLL